MIGLKHDDACGVDAPTTEPSPRPESDKMRAMTTPMRALRRSLRASVRQAKATQAMEMGLSTRREMHATRMATMAKKRANEANEAMLMQQMLDAMSLGDEKDESENAAQETHQPRQAGLVTLPVTGVVLDVKNNIAAISGLRHATLGSVVAVYNCSETEEDDLDANDRICRGVVLFLEKKVAHVALFREAGQIDAIKNVQIGMQVRLEDQELRVPVSLGRMTGRAVNPLGEPIELVYDKAHEPLADEVVPSANDHVSIAWGSKTVPGLMTRGPLREPFATGVLAIDCLKPLAFGHRFGILGPRNSGKTRLVLDIIAQQVKLAKEAGQEPPHFVYVSVGKSPTRVQQILQFLEQTEALVHTTIVSADERDSLIMQYLAPFSGCAIAEYFMKNSKSKQSVVVYDDLATHTTVVESLVQTMKLPKVSQLSLSAHTVLMERSAQFLKPTPSSLTAFALADTPDSATGEVSEFMERMKSIVDDSVVLEAQMARSRVYPPIDVLMPGSSVRGPPFQSVPVWTYMNRVRSRINESSAAKEGIDVSISLGLEVEPEDAEVLEFQELVRQFFAQQPLKNLSKAEKELGVFFLATIRMALLPPQTTMDDLVREALELLREENPELLHLVEAHPTDKKWSRETEEQLEKVLLQALAVLRRKQQEAARSGKTPMLPAAVLRRLGRI